MSGVAVVPMNLEESLPLLFLRLERKLIRELIRTGRRAHTAPGRIMRHELRIVAVGL